MTDGDIRKFLHQVSQRRDGATRNHLSLATRKEDRVRQKCRKNGLVVFENRGNGPRWHITKKGLEWVEAHHGEWKG